MRKFAPLMVIVLLAGCATAVPRAGTQDSGRVCQDGRTDWFIGKAASEQLGAEMLAASGARSIRWVPFGAMITMEFNASRLTVQLDQQNRVNMAKCG